MAIRSIRSYLYNLRHNVRRQTRNVARLPDLMRLGCEAVTGIEAQRPPQFAFLHISKTAGTTVHHFLTEAIEGEFYRGDFDEATPESLERYALITGHMSFAHVRKFRKPCHVITFLRDPVERVVSTYFYLRRWNGEALGQHIRLAKEMTFREFLECDHPSVITFTREHQTYTLARDYRCHRVYDRDMMLARAWANLQSCWFVGFVEHFDPSMRLLCRKLGVPYQRLQAANATSGRPSQAQISESDIALVRELNTLDQKLYDMAWDRFGPPLFRRDELAGELRKYRERLKAKRRASAQASKSRPAVQMEPAMGENAQL